LNAVGLSLTRVVIRPIRIQRIPAVFCRRRVRERRDVVHNLTLGAQCSNSPRLFVDLVVDVVVDVDIDGDGDGDVAAQR